MRSRGGYSRRTSSLRFRFPYVLRVQESVQVADGAEPARARGMRQDPIHLPVLSQHYADEVQSVESPEEGARLRPQDLVAGERTGAAERARAKVTPHGLDSRGDNPPLSNFVP